MRHSNIDFQPFNTQYIKRIYTRKSAISLSCHHIIKPSSSHHIASGVPSHKRNPPEHSVQHWLSFRHPSSVQTSKRYASIAPSSLGFWSSVAVQYQGRSQE